MIFSAFTSALSQMSDARFLRVVGLGVALALALLIAVYMVLSGVAGWLLPDHFALPWVGQVDWIGAIAGWGAFLLFIGLSVFLMVPVAALFSGFFLESVADAVEDRHYPGLPPARPEPVVAAILGAVKFFAVILGVNLVALVLYFFVGPFGPLLFWAVNGYLLGREYFETVATRRIGRQGAVALRRANAGTVWLAGALMAAPLSLPLVNLFVPVLGVATFTHIFHRLIGTQSA
ncbi:MAG: EI24 domain-containing protein [Paracoccaceae bacterium]